MKKYAVGICNLFSNVTEVKIVEAQGEIEAMILGVGDSLDEVLASEFETIEDVQGYYFDGEISVSAPVEI